MGPGTPTKLGTTRSRTERAGRSDVAHWKAAAPAFVPPNRSRDKDGKVMGFFSQDIKNMDDLFMHTLRDIYYAESRLCRRCPR